ncbi:hypothetical protein Hanom_Chr08g00755841 [Helianthus anomalus]
MYVNPHLRLLGKMERARDHHLTYQALPLVCFNVFGQIIVKFCLNLLVDTLVKT